MTPFARAVRSHGDTGQFDCLVIFSGIGLLVSLLCLIEGVDLASVLSY